MAKNQNPEARVKLGDLLVSADLLKQTSGRSARPCSPKGWMCTSTKVDVYINP